MSESFGRTVSSISAPVPWRFGSRIASVEQCTTRSTRRSAAARITDRGAAGIHAIEIRPVARPELGDAGEMVHMPDVGHRRADALRIEDRAGDELDIRGRIVGRRKVENPYARATGAQRVDNMATDEAAAARDQINRHAVTPGCSRHILRLA